MLETNLKFSFTLISPAGYSSSAKHQGRVEFSAHLGAALGSQYLGYAG